MTHDTDTFLAHAGSAPAEHRGAVNVPPYRMSTIVFKTYAEYEKAEYGSSAYGRAGTPTTAAFESAIAALEGAHGSVVTCSGLSAVTLGLLAFTQSGDHVLMPDNAYGPGRRVCEQVLRRYGVSIDYYPPMIGAGLAALIRPNTRVVHLEAPGSFTYEVSDLGLLAKTAKAAGAWVTMDNSWATPLLLRPLDLGVDVSIMSATKYIAGHSDAMLGVLSATETALPFVRRAALHTGVCPGSEEVYQGLRGLHSLHVRLERHGRSALELAQWLSTHPAVKRVLHPALPSCPGHENWKKYFKGSSGTFGIILNETRKDRFPKMLDGMRVFRMGLSWGGFESLLLPEQPGALRTAQPWTETGLSLRIHTGFESVEDLKTDLDEGLKRLAA